MCFKHIAYRIPFQNSHKLRTKTRKSNLGHTYFLLTSKLLHEKKSRF